MDFHHQLKGAVIDAVDEDTSRDPQENYHQGRTPSSKKIKYLNQYELHTLLSSLDLSGKINWDWLIHLVAKPECDF